MAEDDVAGHAQVGQWFRTHLYSRPPLDSPKRGYGDYLLQLHGVAEANFKAHQFMAAHIERWHRRVLLVAAALGFVATSAAAASTVSRVVIFVAAATNTVLLAATARVVSIERATGHRQDATAWLRASHEIDAARIALMDDSLPASAAEQLWRTAVDAVAKARAGEHASPDIRVVQQAQKQYQAGGKLYGNVVLVNTDRVDAWRGENVDGRSPDQPLVTGR